MDTGLVEKLLAGAGLVACAVLLVRMFASPAHQRRLADLWWRVRHWRSTRKTAQVEAERAIERARRGQDVERKGNVYRPKSWGDDTRPPTLH